MSYISPGLGRFHLIWYVAEYVKGAFYIKCIFISTFLGFPNTKARIKYGILVLEIHSHKNTGVKTIPKNLHEKLSSV